MAEVSHLHQIKIGEADNNLTPIDVLFDTYKDAYTSEDDVTKDIYGGIVLSQGALTREFTGTIQLSPHDTGMINRLNFLSNLDQVIFLKDQDNHLWPVIWVGGCNPVWSRPDSKVGTVQFKMVGVLA